MRRIRTRQSDDFFVIPFPYGHIGKIFDGPGVGKTDPRRHIGIPRVFPADIRIDRRHDAVISLGEIFLACFLEDFPQFRIPLRRGIIFVIDRINVMHVARCVMEGAPPHI